MQAYMKSAMPYLGVQATQHASSFVRSSQRTHSPVRGVAGDGADALARGPLPRGRYAAIALTGDRRYRQFQRVEALPLYEELIVTGAWWDLVDELATHRMGDLLRLYPEPMRATMLDLEPRRRYVEAAHGDPLPDQVQGGH